MQVQGLLRLQGSDLEEDVRVGQERAPVVAVDVVRRPIVRRAAAFRLLGGAVPGHGLVEAPVLVRL